MAEPAAQSGGETYLDRFKKLEPISSLADYLLTELLAQSLIEKKTPETVLFAEDSDRDTMFYLLSGSITATPASGDAEIVVEAGTEQAKIPLNSEHHHFRSARVSTPAVIAMIDAEFLDKLLTWSQITAPEAEVMMDEEGIISLNKSEWLKSMFKLPIFQSLPATNVEQLLNRLEPIRVHAGDVIIRQGDVGDYFYMIDKGSAMVTINPENDEDSVIMAELSEGATFGEAALISDKPRNATVTMMDDGILLRLSKEDFNNLLKQPNLQQTDFDRARELVEQGKARWIDVRLGSEFGQTHMPGAVNIQMRDMHRIANELDHEHEYICYCDTGNRSSAATFVLNQYGLRASILAGGMHTVPNDYLVSN